MTKIKKYAIINFYSLVIKFMTKLGSDAMLKIIKKALLIWGGICLFLFGLVSLLFPILPGILLSVLGIALIARGSDWFREQHYVKKFIIFVKKKLQKKKGLMAKIASFL